MSDKINLHNVDGFARRSGTDETGAVWTEFDVDPYAGDCDCPEPECDPDICPRFSFECAECAERASSGWLCLDGGEEVCSECVEIVPNEPNEPDDDDIVTSDYVRFYQSGKLVMDTQGINSPPFGEYDWKAAVRAHMDADQYWPNVWLEEERGGYTLLTLDE